MAYATNRSTTLVLFAIGTAALASISAGMIALSVSNSTCGRLVTTLRTVARQDGQQYLEQGAAQQQFKVAKVAQQNHPIVGYYQCHSRPRAVDMVLQRWRAVYPDAPMYMVNDGGDPSLATLAAKYNANYTDSTRTSPVQGKAYIRTVAEMQLFMDRIFSVCQFADYVIRIEDDVIMYKPVNLFSLQYDISGDNPAGLLPSQITDIINSVRTAAGLKKLNDTHYGGFGGTILRCAFFREVQRQGKYPQYFAMLEKVLLEKRQSLPAGTSQFLTYLVYIHGGSIGPFPGLVEYFYKDKDKRKAAGSIEVYHGDKSHYDKTPGDGSWQKLG